MWFENILRGRGGEVRVECVREEVIGMENIHRQG